MRDVCSGSDAVLEMGDGWSVSSDWRWGMGEQEAQLGDGGWMDSKLILEMGDEWTVSSSWRWGMSGQ